MNRATVRTVAGLPIHPLVQKPAWATYALLAANVALFVLQQHLNVLAVFTMTGPAHAVAVATEIASPADMLRLPYPTVAHDLRACGSVRIARSPLP